MNWNTLERMIGGPHSVGLDDTKSIENILVTIRSFGKIVSQPRAENIVEINVPVKSHVPPVQMPLVVSTAVVRSDKISVKKVDKQLLNAVKNVSWTLPQ